MSFEKITIKTLRELAGLIRDGHGLAESNKEMPAQLIAIPEELANPQGVGYLLLSSIGAKALERAVVTLRKEPSLEYMENRDLDKIVQHLSCELFLMRDSLKNAAGLAKKLRSFEEGITKPIDEFEVLVVVDNMVLKCEPIDIAGVHIFRAEREFVEGLNIRAGVVGEEMLKGLIGNTVALVREKGNSRERVVARAREKLRVALDVVRFAFEDHTTRLINWRVTDFEMRFSDGELYVIRRVNSEGGGEGAQIGWKIRGDRAVAATLNETMRKQCEAVAGLTDVLFKPNAQGDITAYFIRAVEWIGNSARSDSYDDRIVDLCVALETMLAKKDDVKKGESIALRYLLLCLATKNPWFDPGLVLHLYEERSNIVHGSKRGIGTKSDFERGTMLAIEAFWQALEFCRNNGTLKHSKFLVRLETEEGLEKAVEWLSKENSKEYTAMIGIAETLLSSLKQKGARGTSVAE